MISLSKIKKICEELDLRIGSNNYYDNCIVEVYYKHQIPIQTCYYDLHSEKDPETNETNVLFCEFYSMIEIGEEKYYEKMRILYDFFPEVPGPNNEIEAWWARYRWHDGFLLRFRAKGIIKKSLKMLNEFGLFLKQQKIVEAKKRMEDDFK